MAKSKTSFQKGQSGNPGGRSPRVGPNGETLAQMIRARTAELVNRAFDIALDPKTEAKEAIAALFGLMDRGHGKPKESIEMDLQADVKSNAPIINLTVTRPASDDSA